MPSRSLFHARAPKHSIRAGTDQSAEVLIYDEIGMWGLAARDFVPQLKALNVDTINVRINSPGGDVFDGVAIFNALRAHPARIVTHIDAMAASIASLIALAGDEIRMADNAFFMIHDVWGMTVGTAADHRKTADLLETVGETTLVPAYAKQTGKRADTIRKLMAAETWFTADEAKAEGFVDTIDSSSSASAEYDLSVFRNTPAVLLGDDEDENEPNVRELERALRDAGLSRTAAKAVLSDGMKSLHDKKRNTLLRDAGESELLAASQRLLSKLNAGALEVCLTP